MQRVVQNTPVMLAKVAEAKDVVDEPDAGPSLAKAYAMEVMQTIKEILKLNPFFKEQMQVHALRVPSECLPSALRVPFECLPSALRVPSECLRRAF